ncbi:MAG: hypothetical protein M1831_004545 [Alyxoria varia]|nr:MAG: hypothetical protein M1831_004545 [Alyxoria varia]
MAEKPQFEPAPSNLTTLANPSFILSKQNHTHFEDRPIPELTSPTSVRILITHTGICGSDIHYLTHGQLGNFIVKNPIVLGHESSGIVESIGTSVTTLQPGDRIALEPGIPCRVCNPCKSGLYNLCPSTKFAATPPVDGTLARYYTLPEDFCYKLPAHVSQQEGALIEPLAVAVHIVRQAPVSPGQTVLVFGAGPVGLLCMAVARAFGASHIVASDVNATRLAFARSYAADATFAPEKGETPEAAAARLVSECGLSPATEKSDNRTSVGADVVIEASGAASAAATGAYAVAAAGTFVQGGMGAPTFDGFPFGALMAKEVTVRTSFRYKQGDYGTAVGLVERGRVDVKGLVSLRVGFGEAGRAFQETIEGRVVKAVIEGPEGGPVVDGTSS